LISKLNYRLGKTVLKAIGSAQLQAINQTPIARLALEATYGAGCVTAAIGVYELQRLKKEMRRSPFDRDLQQKFARVLALFGADYPINDASDKRLRRLAKRRGLSNAVVQPCPKTSIGL
jgi:hypothetical protein